MKKILSIFLASSILIGCSSTHEFTTDTEEMDIGNTVGLIVGIAAAAYLASQSGGGGGGYCDNEPSLRDYQPVNNQWVCRSIETGQYSNACNCAGQDYVDNWQ